MTLHKKIDDLAALEAAYTSRAATVGIVGLGYVGLPLAKAIGDVGFKIVGVDVDDAKVKALMSGKSYIRHLPHDLFDVLIEEKRFFPTTDFAALSACDAILICVPTPLTKQREPDLTYVINTAKSIVPHLRRGQLIVLESTTYPGTTRDELKPVLEESGLVAGRDFFLAYSPEREDPGNANFTTHTIPKVIGGDGPDALRLTKALYDQFITKTVPVSSAETAEAVKITENIFRSVNIALVNELKVIYAAMGIDVWEVIDAAATKPFGFMPFYPGPGLGGHCIPIDPFYLTWKAREFEMPTRFIELAGEINTAMPRHVVMELAEQLDTRFAKGLNKARILMLGIAYKKNVDDMRESPALRLIELLEHRGANVDYFDPFIPVIPMTREHAPLANRKSVNLTAEEIASHDAVLVVTDHDGVDYALVQAHAKLVMDTRNIMSRSGALGDNVTKA